MEEFRRAMVPIGLLFSFIGSQIIAAVAPSQEPPRIDETAAFSYAAISVPDVWSIQDLFHFAASVKAQVRNASTLQRDTQHPDLFKELQTQTEKAVEQFRITAASSIHLNLVNLVEKRCQCWGELWQQSAPSARLPSIDDGIKLLQKLSAAMDQSTWLFSHYVWTAYLETVIGREIVQRYGLPRYSTALETERVNAWVTYGREEDLWFVRHLSDLYIHLVTMEETLTSNDDPRILELKKLARLISFDIIKARWQLDPAESPAQHTLESLCPLSSLPRKTTQLIEKAIAIGTGYCQKEGASLLEIERLRWSLLIHSGILQEDSERPILSILSGGNYLPFERLYGSGVERRVFSNDPLRWIDSHLREKGFSLDVSAVKKYFMPLRLLDLGDAKAIGQAMRSTWQKPPQAILAQHAEKYYKDYEGWLHPAITAEGRQNITRAYLDKFNSLLMEILPEDGLVILIDRIEDTVLWELRTVAFLTSVGFRDLFHEFLPAEVINRLSLTDILSGNVVLVDTIVRGMTIEFGSRLRIFGRPAAEERLRTST